MTRKSCLPLIENFMLSLEQITIEGPSEFYVDILLFVSAKIAFEETVGS